LDAKYYLSLYLNERARILSDMERFEEAMMCNNEALSLARGLGTEKLVESALQTKKENAELRKSGAR